MIYIPNTPILYTFTILVLKQLFFYKFWNLKDYSIALNCLLIKIKKVSTKYDIFPYHGHVVRQTQLFPRGVDHFPGTDVSDVLHGWRHTEERLHGTSTPAPLPDRHT